MLEEPAHRFARVCGVRDEQERARGHEDGPVGAIERQRLHALLVQPRRDADRVCLVAADRQHLGRVIHAFAIDAPRQIVEHQPPGAAADIQRWFAVAPDRVQIERAVGPGRVVAAQQIPRLGLQVAIFVRRCRHGRMVARDARVRRAIERAHGAQRSVHLFGEDEGGTPSNRLPLDATRRKMRPCMQAGQGRQAARRRPHMWPACQR